MNAKGLHQGYDQFGIGILGLHDQWLPPFGPPLKFMPHALEGPAFLGWPVGKAIGLHKAADKCLYDGAPAICWNHDVGYLILHLPFVPNVMMAINTLLSKHKIVWPISKVLLQGQMMGVYMPLGGADAFGEICSSPVSLPLGFYVGGNTTVTTQITLADVTIGIYTLLFDMAFDALFSQLLKRDIWRFKLISKVFKKAGTGTPGRVSKFLNKSGERLQLKLRPDENVRLPALATKVGLPALAKKVGLPPAKAIKGLERLNYKGMSDAIQGRSGPLAEVARRVPKSGAQRTSELFKLAFPGLWKDKLFGNVLIRQVGSKLIDHGFKSWIFKPVVGGHLAGFLAEHGVLNIPKSARTKASPGRGNFRWT